jgi:hypothetical protein
VIAVIARDRKTKALPMMALMRTGGRKESGWQAIVEATAKPYLG